MNGWEMFGYLVGATASVGLLGFSVLSLMIGLKTVVYWLGRNMAMGLAIPVLVLSLIYIGVGILTLSITADGLLIIMFGGILMWLSMRLFRST